MDFDSYERYPDFETGVLHRISSRVYLAEWFGLGRHFGKILVWALSPENTMVICGERFPTMISAPNVDGSL